MKIVPFRKSAELRAALAAVPDPVYLLRALPPKQIMLASGCPEQVGLNRAIRDYIRGLTEKAKAFSVKKDLCLAVHAYREAKAALRYVNTQRTKYIPQEILEAEQAFEDLLEALDPFAHLFPPETQPVFWKARVFRKAQVLTADLETPRGLITVGVKREARDPRWWPFVAWRDEKGEAREARAEYYISAGTLSGKGSLTASPLYEDTDGREFWGVEVSWTTRTGKQFAWEVRLTGGYPRFSLVREDPSFKTPEEIRQGDVFFSPEDFLRGEPHGIPELVRSCRFNPTPVGWTKVGDEWYVAQFESTTSVVISHPDHRTIKVRVGKAGVSVRSVGGQTHFRPWGRGGD